MRLYGLLGGGGKYIFVCKACGKLGGSGGMLSHEILILDVILDTIWDCFHTNINYHFVIKNLIYTYSVYPKVQAKAKGRQMPGITTIHISSHRAALEVFSSNVIHSCFQAPFVPWLCSMTTLVGGGAYFWELAVVEVFFSSETIFPSMGIVVGKCL